MKTSTILWLLLASAIALHAQVLVTERMAGMGFARPPAPSTSGIFDVKGGNAVALLATFQGFATGDVISATFASQSMTLGVSTNHGAQWSGIFYLLNPAATSGRLKITTTGTNITDGAYSVIALTNVAGVADVDAVASTASSGNIALRYTIATNGGFVLGSVVNNGSSSEGPPPSFITGNANQVLFGPLIVNDNCGNLHTYGAVPTAGNHTDVYGNPVGRNAYVTLAFEAASYSTNPPPGLLPPAPGRRQMEKLGRGVVAINKGSANVYVSWRVLGLDPLTLGSTFIVPLAEEQRSN